MFIAILEALCGLCGKRLPQKDEFSCKAICSRKSYVFRLLPVEKYLLRAGKQLLFAGEYLLLLEKHLSLLEKSFRFPIPASLSSS